ncbi:IS1380 family transposase [Sphingobacterium cavernae]|uniref:IS1380 family transposase n=2 Tax=Sphingobacterium TaxID=28453 RepID=UPI00122FF1AB|nr:IS1380 family transposase [Sphingobacterium cavernae]
MKFELSFTNQEITPWGGMFFLKQMLDKIGFREQIENCTSLPVSQPNNSYKKEVLLESFITSIWCGANRFLHTEITRSDRALGQIFDWRKTPGQDAYKRYFGKFTQNTNQEVGHHFFSWFFQNININYFTLDIDSSVVTRYGAQDGAKKGYNPKKKGRNSHHPIIAFVNEVKMVANFWLRSGNTSSANNFIGFLEETLSVFGAKKVGLVRLNSGFCQKDIFEHLEQKALKYIVAAKFTHPVQHLIDEQDTWLMVDEGIEICDKHYQGKTWDKQRRLVIVRQKIANRPNATGRTLSLFPEDEIHRNYRYSAYFTNNEFAATDVWRMYRQRGDAENRIKELKADFGAESFNLKAFYATEAALIFSMIAYNLMSIFRIFVLQEKTQKTLSTLRYRTFAIGAYFEKVGDTLKLKIALTKKRRKWFRGLWDYPIDLQMKISTA